MLIASLFFSMFLSIQTSFERQSEAFMTDLLLPPQKSVMIVSLESSHELNSLLHITKQRSHRPSGIVDIKTPLSSTLANQPTFEIKCLHSVLIDEPLFNPPKYLV